MKVYEFAKKLNFEVLTGNRGLEKEISGVYACDLLSWVISHSKKGDAWITVHTHLNVVAVALMSELPCIVIPENIRVDVLTIDRANQEGVAILSTELNAYDICWKAHELLNHE